MHKQKDTDMADEFEKVPLLLSKRMLAAVERLKKRMGTTSRADVFRHAIDFTLCIADEIDKGNTLCLETKEGIKKIFIPFLDTEAGELLN